MEVILDASGATLTNMQTIGAQIGFYFSQNVSVLAQELKGLDTSIQSLGVSVGVTNANLGTIVSILGATNELVVRSEQHLSSIIAQEKTLIELGLAGNGVLLDIAAELNGRNDILAKSFLLDQRQVAVSNRDYASEAFYKGTRDIALNASDVNLWGNTMHDVVKRAAAGYNDRAKGRRDEISSDERSAMATVNNYDRLLNDNFSFLYDGATPKEVKKATRMLGDDRGTLATVADIANAVRLTPFGETKFASTLDGLSNRFDSVLNRFQDGATQVAAIDSVIPPIV